MDGAAATAVALISPRELMSHTFLPPPPPNLPPDSSTHICPPSPHPTLISLLLHSPPSHAINF